MGVIFIAFFFFAFCFFDYESERNLNIDGVDLNQEMYSYQFVELTRCKQFSKKKKGNLNLTVKWKLVNLVKPGSGKRDENKPGVALGTVMHLYMGKNRILLD